MGNLKNKTLVIIILLILVVAGLTAATRYTPGSDTLNGTVFDSTTGLRWLRCPLIDQDNADSSTDCSASHAGFTWTDALDACEGLTFAGQTWRLPSIRELQSITVVYYNKSASINRTVFPGKNHRIYISSTTYSGRSLNNSTIDFGPWINNVSHFWGLDFGYGNINPYRKLDSTTDDFDGETLNHMVRCVAGP